MSVISRLVVALFVMFGASAALAAGKPFLHQGVVKDAERYETYLKANWRIGGKSPADLKVAGEKALAKDPRGASRSYAAAVVADERDAEAWIGLAKALLAIKPDPDKSERWDLPVNASGAAYTAYERATSADVKARALFVLSQAMQRRSYWRPAIDAMKISLELADNSAAREAYEKLRAQHGFRMTDYKTESETSPPRLCLQFSEELARGQIDFAKYVAVGGKDPQGVTAESQQLCVEGLRHGERYEVSLRAGLPSAVGEDLTKQIDIAVYIPDRRPMVRFSGRSYVLPSRGQQGIPVLTVNTKKVEVEVYRINDRSLVTTLQSGDFQRQLSNWEVTTIKDRTGVRVFKGEMDVVSKLNEEITTAVPVSDALATLEPGAYALIAKPADKLKEEYDDVATQWFIVSDLGLTAFSGDDGVHAFVRSLAAATPVGGATVKLIAKNNEVLATAKADANGYARFEPGQSKGEGGLSPAVLVAEHGSGEYAFLDLTTTAFDLSDRGVKGRDASGPLDAFLYTDRGVYRPGEDVHLASIVRDRAGKAATLPVTMIVTRPDGVEHRRFALSDMGLGGREATLTLGSGVMTGTWRAKVYTDPNTDPLTQVTFLVEDFVPERIDMTLEAPQGTLSPAETKVVKAAGKYLYGPPATGLAIEGEVVVKPSARAVEGYPGYRFGSAEEVVNPVREPLAETATTDAAGKAEVRIALPQVPRTAKPLEASVILRLKETGGRAIERTLTLPVDLKQPRIGVKPLFADDSVAEDQSAAFEVVMLDENSKPVGRSNLSWRLVRLDTSWQWYRRDNTWNYEAVTLSRKVAAGDLKTAAEAPARIEQRLPWGRYKLEVLSAEAGGPLTSVVFNAGWYIGNETAESPEMLDIALDAKTYKAGDTAKLRIATKHGGKALISVLGSTLLSMQEVELPKGGGEVAVAVGKDWGPGAYVTALMYRPMDEAAKRMPSRAIGVRWLPLDQADSTLKVTMSPEPKIPSGSTLMFPVKIEGLQQGEEARVTVAAVDLGVLNLTRFAAPSPESWLFAQRKLGVEIRDFYGRLIDGMRAERGALRSGGDGMSLDTAGTPPVEQTVAMFSGIVTIGADGMATVAFEMPNFNGTVRLMAVAWSKDKVGHGQADVIVRDAVAITTTAPRFLTLGDEARLAVDLHNVEGKEGDYRLAITEADEDAGRTNEVAARAVALKAGERKTERVPLKPTDVGVITYNLNVSGPDGIAINRSMTIEVKPPAGDIKRTTVAVLKAGGGKLTVSGDLVEDLIASRSKVSISVGPNARLDVPGLLAALDRYPYGCAEQTVSRALPLVYANAVASALGIGQDKQLKERVQKAVDRVFEMQDSSGAFGIWGPSSSQDIWLTSYVTDFLSRAKETGYVVDQRAFGLALDRLSNYIAYAEDFEAGGEERAYALYVLARNSRAPIGELRYYADTRLDRFSSPLAKAQIGAALSMMGDKERSERAFKAAIAMMDESLAATESQAYRADYGSRLRDSAGIVTLASETGVLKAEAPKLVNVIAEAYAGRTYTSTQEQAWMLLAANALGDEVKKATLLVDGAPVQAPILRSLTVDEVKAKALTVVNDGERATDAVVTVIGASLKPEPEVSKGFTIERSFYTLDGKPIDLASAKGGTSSVAQNDRMIAVVKVTSDQPGGRVMLVDRLPAGLEIENPRLVGSGDVKSLGWLKSAIAPEHTEFRDDRLVAAFNLVEKRADADATESVEDPAAAEVDAAGPAPAASATVAYVVRAVTPGKFVHPAATVEDMYRPERHARTAAGTLSVTAKE